MRVRAAAGVGAVAAVLAACTGHPAPAPVQPTGPLLGFDRPSVVRSNGPLPVPRPATVCGSATTTFLGDFRSASPGTTAVPLEWAEVKPGAQIAVSGTITEAHASGGDFLFAHPFGKDIDVTLAPDAPFAGLVRQSPLAVANGMTLILEIEHGLIPHGTAQGFEPGFVPQKGDRIAAVGRWIIDCGHGDFHTEIHPPTFLGLARRDGSSTLAFAFYNPYRSSQVYNSNPTLANDFSYPPRFTDKGTKPFAAFSFVQLLKIAHLGPAGDCCADHLGTHDLLEANAASPLSWVVCAPGPVPSGGHTTVSYGGAIRRGVALSVSPAGTNGCATFRLSVGRTYRPFVPVRHDCTWSWRILNAEAALAANDPKLNIEQLIESKLPAQYRPAVARDPTYDCYDALQDHDPNGAGYSTGKSGIVTNDDQPFPFVGWARVTWAGSN